MQRLTCHARKLESVAVYVVLIIRNSCQQNALVAVVITCKSLYIHQNQLHGLYLHILDTDENKPKHIGLSCFTLVLLLICIICCLNVHTMPSTFWRFFDRLFLFLNIFESILNYGSFDIYIYI